MTKNEILTNLDSAEVAHLAWVDKATALVHTSNQITKNEIPLESTSCSFGKWFFGVGQVLFCIMSEELVKNVEQTHQELHNSYHKIFKIYFKDTMEISLLSRPNINIEPKEQEKAELELRNLENISERLILLLKRIKENFTQIENEDLKGICN